MFFESCKFIIRKREEYLKFRNHYTDVLHGQSSFGNVKQFPVYVFLDSGLKLEHSCQRHEYDRRKIKRTSVATFLDVKYTVTYHFRQRFNERFGKVSDSRFRKLTNTMLERGTWLKRKDSIKLMKYKKTSDYVLYDHYEDNEKKYHLIVLSNGNILTTMYEFDIKDLKYFREL